MDTSRGATQPSEMEQTRISAPKYEKKIGKSVSYFHDFLTAANLEKKEYQTEGIRFCLRNEISPPALPFQTCIRGGIVADEMGLGKVSTSFLQQSLRTTMHDGAPLNLSCAPFLRRPFNPFRSWHTTSST